MSRRNKPKPFSHRYPSPNDDTNGAYTFASKSTVTVPNITTLPPQTHVAPRTRSYIPKYEQHGNSNQNSSFNTPHSTTNFTLTNFNKNIPAAADSDWYGVKPF